VGPLGRASWFVGDGIVRKIVLFKSSFIICKLTLYCGTSVFQEYYSAIARIRTHVAIATNIHRQTWFVRLLLDNAQSDQRLCTQISSMMTTFWNSMLIPGRNLVRKYLDFVPS
jgi:hypothetical protein